MRNIAPGNLARDNRLRTERAADMPNATPEAPDRTPETDRPKSPAAERALAEAAARRAELDARAEALARAREVNGRGGKDPVRYDDWEVKGLAIDF